METLAGARFCGALLVVLESEPYPGKLMRRFKELRHSHECILERFFWWLREANRREKRLCFSE